MYNRNLTPSHMVHSFSSRDKALVSRLGVYKEVREPIVLVSCKKFNSSSCFQLYIFFLLLLLADLSAEAHFGSFPLTFSAASLQPASSVSSFPSFLLPIISGKLPNTNESLWFSLLHGFIFLLCSYASIFMRSQGTCMFRPPSFTK